MAKPLEKDLWSACMFAKKLQREGMAGGLANYKAGQYYGYTSSEVGAARATLRMEYGARDFYKSNGKTKYGKSRRRKEASDAATD